MADPFDSAWLKWGQAVLHAHDLYDKINTLDLSGEDFCKIGTEYDAKRHCLSTRVAWIADPLPTLSVTLGDVVNNYRSCLDHIAWTLVGRGTTPPMQLNDWEQAGIYFPICNTRDEFNASLVTITKKGRTVKRAKLPGVRIADRAIVRRYQPYIRGKRNLDLHVLAALDTLARQDKHREIWPILVIPQGQGGFVLAWPPQDCTETRRPSSIKSLPLQVGTEIHCVYVCKTGPNPRMQVHPHLTVEPAITPRITVREWLAQTRGFIYGLLREFADPPLGTLEELGVLDVVTIP
jgi:hypothetical protein